MSTMRWVVPAALYRLICPAVPGLMMALLAWGVSSEMFNVELDFTDIELASEVAIPGAPTFRFLYLRNYQRLN